MITSLNANELSNVLGGNKPKRRHTVATCATMIGTGMASGVWKGATAGSVFGQPITAGAGALLGASVGAIGGSVACGGWLLGGGR